MSRRGLDDVRVAPSLRTLLDFAPLEDRYFDCKPELLRLRLPIGEFGLFDHNVHQCLDPNCHAGNPDRLALWRHCDQRNEFLAVGSDGSGGDSGIVALPGQHVMEEDETDSDPTRLDCAEPGRFPPTRWTRVLAARGSGQEAERALNDLCQVYWYPLYFFARRQGQSAEDAKDSTQGFFADLLRCGGLKRADRDKGRLRSFLLGGIKNHMAAQHRRQTAEKRGAGERVLSIDYQEAEDRYQVEPQEESSPDLDYDRRWAWALLHEVVAKLGAEYESRGQSALFAELGPSLASGGQLDYDAVAGRLGLQPGAVRTALSRMRKRYRDRLVQEVAETVVSPDLVEDELNGLLAALRGHR